MFLTNGSYCVDADSATLDTTKSPKVDHESNIWHSSEARNTADSDGAASTLMHRHVQQHTCTVTPGEEKSHGGQTGVADWRGATQSPRRMGLTQPEITVGWLSGWMGAPQHEHSTV